MYAATATTAVTLLAALSMTVAQEIGFTDGANVVDGPNAISNPVVNNGWMSDSSLISGLGGSSSAAPDVFNNVAGSDFVSVNANMAIKDNLVNNPSFTGVSGNSGWTANGDSNQLGPVSNAFGVHKRGGDVIFADNHHQVNSQVAAAVPAAPLAYAWPYFQPFVAAAPLQYAQPAYVQPALVQPAYVQPAYTKPVVAPHVVAQPAHVEATQQKATIIQNKA
ncbi:hypothetical protein H4R18_004335 [Coemansia javaensis]|uniref:Uncharacterized protein n=1 Tax=Coemansia javaensis TaxID=2761396 RepID=A0A9W8LEZ7_9FUNG|nr:hypothetical protein H4R18_004335 [Coemansia javaensis]